MIKYMPETLRLFYSYVSLYLLFKPLLLGDIWNHTFFIRSFLHQTTDIRKNMLDLEGKLVFILTQFALTSETTKHLNGLQKGRFLILQGVIEGNTTWQFCLRKFDELLRGPKQLVCCGLMVQKQHTLDNVSKWQDTNQSLSQRKEETSKEETAKVTSATTTSPSFLNLCSLLLNKNVNATQWDCNAKWENRRCLQEIILQAVPPAAWLPTQPILQLLLKVFLIQINFSSSVHWKNKLYFLF